MICNNCGYDKGEVTNYHHLINIKNHMIEFDLPRLLCQKCHSIIANEELDNNANLELIKRFNEEYGITREQLINLRKKFNLSQEAFARIIGCAKKTLVSYETGSSIPNDIYMSVLKLLWKEPLIIFDLLKVNEEDYSKEDYEQLIKRINIGLNEKGNNSLDDLILYFAENGIAKTKILLSIFFVDCNSKKLTHQRYTTNNYLKNANGLICEEIDKAINHLIIINKIERIYDVSGNKEMDYLKAVNNIEINNIIVSDVKKMYKLANVEQMINNLKENKEFLNTSNGKIIDI